MSAAAERCDVAIVGGGMVGASLALALQGMRHSVVLLEALPPGGAAVPSPPGAQDAPGRARVPHPGEAAQASAAQPSFDARTTALGNGARRIYQTLGVWDAIAAQAAPIRSIQVSDAGHFGSTRLEARRFGLEALGYTVGNRHLGAVLWAALRARAAHAVHAVQLRAPARVLEATSLEHGVRLRIEPGGLLTARLVVAADGANSLVKLAAGIDSDSRPYGQVALVTNVLTDPPAGSVAHERFTDRGPLACLPLYDGAYTVVWTLAPSEAEALRVCDAAQFCERLQRALGWRVGRVLHAGARSAYPLALVRARTTTAPRTALVGNAAQTLHPVAAQGFNLGLRDAAALAERIAAADDPGAPQVLDGFAREREPDRAGMIAFTDRLVRAFSSRRPELIAARNLALCLFEVTPPAQRALSRLSWGFGATLPRLSRGLPLSGPA